MGTRVRITNFARRARSAPWPRCAQALFYASVSAAFAAGAPAHAQSWPSRPITIIVAFTPGTGVDLIARGLGAKLAERLPAAVVIDNRPGASGNIGHEHAAKAAADGHTLLVTAGTMVNNAAVNRDLRYDPIRQFAPIALLATGAQVLIVGPRSDAQTVGDLIAAAKASPGKLFYATPGNGTAHHLAMELFKIETVTDIVHVPYKGFGGAINDIIGGRIETMILPLSAAVPYTRNGQVRMLAIVANARSPVFPDVPTLAEAGYGGVQASNWYALLAPAGTPAEILARLNVETNAILNDAGMRETLAKQGFTPSGGSAERLAALMKAELERWQAVVTRANIKAD